MATVTSKAVEIVNGKTGQQRTVETPAVFSFIGATPRTGLASPGDRARRQGLR